MPRQTRSFVFKLISPIQAEEALEEVSHYLDKIGSIYQAKQNVDFSFVDNIFGTLSDSEADELCACWS